MDQAQSTRAADRLNNAFQRLCENAAIPPALERPFEAVDRPGGGVRVREISLLDPARLAEILEAATPGTFVLQPGPGQISLAVG
jgi:hypothetical protein